MVEKTTAQEGEPGGGDTTPKRRWRPRVISGLLGGGARSPSHRDATANSNRKAAGNGSGEDDISVTVETIPDELPHHQQQNQANSTVSSAAVEGRDEEQLLAATELSRVRASTCGGGSGGNSATGRLMSCLPGVVGDEEDGILAMMGEIGSGVVVPYAGAAGAATKRALVRLFDALVSIAAPIRESDVAKVLYADGEDGMRGMFREIGESLPDTSSASEYMDAFLAKILHASYLSSTSSSSSSISKAKFPNISALTDVQEITIDDDDDISLVGMFKEVVASKFPGTSGKDAEDHILSRMSQVWVEATSSRRQQQQQQQRDDLMRASAGAL